VVQEHVQAASARADLVQAHLNQQIAELKQTLALQRSDW